MNNKEDYKVYSGICKRHKISPLFYSDWLKRYKKNIKVKE